MLSRYYNPYWRRFLTPNNYSYLDLEDINDLNLFAYCNNNPVAYIDSDGRFGIVVAGISIGAYELLVALGLITAAAAVVTTTVLESKYHFIENAIDELIDELTKNINSSFSYIKKKTYERKKAAPRIKKKSKKEAKQAAFFKGGKKEPIFHNGKHGPHYHPNDPKFKHWHYYFSLLNFISEHDENEEDYDEQIPGIFYI